MGIYDREYYRREGPSFLGSFVERGKVCRYLILINVVFFVIQWIAPHDSHSISHEGITIEIQDHESVFTKALWLDPSAVLHGQVWRLITHAFLHDTRGFPWHIIFNMLFLWWFGNEVEDLYGPKEFLAFYLVGALMGGIGYQLGAMLGNRNPCLGASGAVTAVMVVFAFHYPARVIYVFGLVPIPIWLFVALNVGKDMVGFLSTLNGMEWGTAFAGHLGGAAFGFAYYKMHWRVLNWLPDFSAWRKNRARSRSKLRVYREEEPVRTPVAVAAPPSQAGDVDEQLEAKLDAVLQKVSQSGKESLTDSERQILVRASEIYKKRRS